MQKIIVVGDVTIDWLQWAMKPNNNNINLLNWKQYPGYHYSAREGGALLIKKMMEEITDKRIISYKLENEIESISSNKIIHSASLLDEYTYKTDKIYRISKFMGFCGPDNFPKSLKIKNDEYDVDMIIIDDAGNGFRFDSTNWPKVLKSDKTPFIILKMSKPLFNGDL